MDQNQDQPQSTPKQQVVERLKQANNVLVTVKTNPNVDELAAAIGLTLMLNKLEKHTTAVFSGEVPSTLEFLKPEETIETNTDSLRDFIVSLDKSKADKLRYKVEENVVKIFITPYRTSITEEDLEFTQGDFNVDVIVALGVTQREEIDQAITMHGRILHDATVITVTAGQDATELGQINWQEPAASSLSEMLVSISEAFQGGLIDEQIATAFLTGIVSETERFSNTKTTPKVMTMSAQLMAAGANQQLIANELEKAVEVDVQNPPALAEEPAPEAVAGNDGSLTINHDRTESEPAPEEKSEPAPAELPEVSEEKPAEEAVRAEEPLMPPSQAEASSLLPSEPPKPEGEGSDLYNPLMSSTEPAPVNPGSDRAPEAEPEALVEQPIQEVSTPEPAAPIAEQPAPKPVENERPDDDGQIHIDQEGNLIRKNASKPKHKVIQPLPEQAPDPAPELGKGVLPPPPKLDLTPPPPIQDTTTLEQLERSVNSPHIAQAEQLSSGSVDNARGAVDSALGMGSSSEAATTDLPENNMQSSSSSDTDKLAPPPVPPPMMPQ